MAIDWTKPIETSDGTPSHYIGRRMDKTRVVEFGGLIFSCENDGSIHGHKSIIIRNIEPYLAIAKEFDIEPLMITCESQFGSIHVGDDVVRKMRDRWEDLK